MCLCSTNQRHSLALALCCYLYVEYIHRMFISISICKCFQCFKNVIRICLPLIYQSNELTHICTDNNKMLHVDIKKGTIDLQIVFTLPSMEEKIMKWISKWEFGFETPEEIRNGISIEFSTYVQKTNIQTRTQTSTAYKSWMEL